MTERGSNKYATSSIPHQPRDYFPTLAEAEQDAQYKAETYLIPYHAFSLVAMDETMRGEHRTLRTFQPPPKKKRKGCWL